MRAGATLLSLPGKTATSHFRGDHLAAVGRLVKVPAFVEMHHQCGVSFWRLQAGRTANRRSWRATALRHKRPYSEPVVLLLPDPARRAAMGLSRGKGLMERNRRRYATFNVPFALTFAITAASELPVSRSDAFAIHRVQSLLPAWLVVLLIVPRRRPHMTL
jgi:hypothetical protein